MNIRAAVRIFYVVVVATAVGTHAHAQVGQDAIARQILSTNARERGEALSKARAIPIENIGPELRKALMVALRHEGRLHERVRRQEIGFLDNPELLPGLAQIVAQFEDPTSIPALAGALGTSPPAAFALADFGEPAARVVLGLLTSTDDPSVVMDALVSLRLMAEELPSQPLSAATLEQMRFAAEQRLTATRFITTLWMAIDLAVALDDPHLTRIVRSLASSREAVISRGVTDPDDIDKTQRLAAARLAGVPPLPRRH